MNTVVCCFESTLLPLPSSSSHHRYEIALFLIKKKDLLHAHFFPMKQHVNQFWLLKMEGKDEPSNNTHQYLATSTTVEVDKKTVFFVICLISQDDIVCIMQLERFTTKWVCFVEMLDYRQRAYAQKWSTYLYVQTDCSSFKMKGLPFTCTIVLAS